jgi:hypothetical protein
MTASEIKFTASQVCRSIVKFHDYGNDLVRSETGTLKDRLNHFLDFCQKDVVFSYIYDQLRLIGKNIKFEEWWESKDSRSSLVFPTDEDQRIFIMFCLLNVVRDSNDCVNFLVGFSNRFKLSYSTYIDQLIRAFHDTITAPLVRDLGYKLDDMLDNLPDDNKVRVEPSIFQIFHGTVISQNAFGDNNSQTANIDNSSELGLLFDKLEQLIKKDIPNHDQEDYLALIDSSKTAALTEKNQSKSKSLLNTLKRFIVSTPTLAKGADAVVSSIDHIIKTLHSLM